MVLCRKGPSGRPRIEMYRSEDSVGGQQPVRMIDLETVRSVQPVGEPEKVQCLYGGPVVPSVNIHMLTVVLHTVPSVTT